MSPDFARVGVIKVCSSVLWVFEFRSRVVMVHIIQLPIETCKPMSAEHGQKS